MDSRVVQQQDDGVELLPGAVISPQGHDEVVEAVAGGLGRHDDELVLEAVRLGVLETVVPAALEEEKATMGEAGASFDGEDRQRQSARSESAHLVEAEAAERGFLRQQMAQGWRAPNIRRVRGVTFHVAASISIFVIACSGHTHWTLKSPARRKFFFFF